MKRILFALPLAGVMMTAPLALAQTTSPAEEAPSQAAPTQQDEVQTERGDCVDLSDGVPPPEGAEEMMESLDDSPDAAEGETTAAADAEQEDGEQAASQDSSSETPPQAGADAGTAPGGSGSSAWTGGLGGSDIGTSQSEELETSPQQDHPAVASGLDPISGETAIEGPQAPAEEPDEDAAMAPTAPDEEARAPADC